MFYHLQHINYGDKHGCCVQKQRNYQHICMCNTSFRMQLTTFNNIQQLSMKHTGIQGPRTEAW